MWEEKTPDDSARGNRRARVTKNISRETGAGWRRQGTTSLWAEVPRRAGRLGRDDNSMHICCEVARTPVTALIDTGSTINPIQLGLLARSKLSVTMDIKLGTVAGQTFGMHGPECPSTQRSGWPSSSAPGVRTVNMTLDRLQQWFYWGQYRRDVESHCCQEGTRGPDEVTSPAGVQRGSDGEGGSGCPGSSSSPHLGGIAICWWPWTTSISGWRHT
ncbi:hypothetical protein SKAU_G00214360 [Synaphobranchus kaupii]|uniref:Uncharacterized protein n=1 Tax=Synaphobranchus kaupii TaxID=118154 RepID=A0A9Q1IUV6_SYNKA|nr:hypothetical protein SKAU_G00214360 [Synaphobranchus kaupii]